MGSMLGRIAVKNSPIVENAERQQHDQRRVAGNLFINPHRFCAH